MRILRPLPAALLVFMAVVTGCRSKYAAPRRDEATQPQVGRPAFDLAFADLFQPDSSALRLTAKTAGLAGKRVRFTGYMAEMEQPPKGGFFLTSRPVRCDEAGGGTGDLPPDAVFAISRSTSGKVVPFLPGLLEVTGKFDVGNRADEDGRVSAFRIELDSDVVGEQANPLPERPVARKEANP